MLGFVGFILLTWFFYRLFYGRKERIDTSKDHKYYAQFLDKEDNELIEPVEPSAPVNIHITNNHLHIHITPEENQRR